MTLIMWLEPSEERKRKRKVRWSRMKGEEEEERMWEYEVKDTGGRIRKSKVN